MTVRCRVCHNELLKACAELAELKAEAERLRKQSQRLRAQLKKLQAKTKHHLSERDRYRDLYAKADKALREESARHPNC